MNPSFVDDVHRALPGDDAQIVVSCAHGRRGAMATKALQDQLNQTIAKVTPKSRFQFKRSTKTQHVDMGAPENDPRLSPGSLSRHGTGRVEASPVLDAEEDTVGELPPKGKDYNEEMARPMAKPEPAIPIKCSAEILEAISEAPIAHQVSDPSARKKSLVLVWPDFLR